MSLHRFFVPPPLALAVVPAPVKLPEKKDDKDGKGSKDPKDGKAIQDAQGDKKDAEVKAEKDGKPTPDEGEKNEGEIKVTGSSEDKDPAQGQADAEKEPEKVSLRMVGPAPPRPVRTKLELDPALPYPPINTDPRGAYHKYAKFIQGEWQLIDVTKDGWLTEQWRELPEREALARLRGESQRAVERQSSEAAKAAQIRKVPHASSEILLELWNELVIAPSHEVSPSDLS